MSSDEADTNPKEKCDDESPPPAKKIRSREPDVIVAVGQGDAMREFPCYAVALSFASEYLDAMLSSSMKEGESSRIVFPDKDPEEWELFYNFVNPATYRAAKITIENVDTLLPWFHEFQMDGFLHECDYFLLNDIPTAAICDNSSANWSNWSKEIRSDWLDKIIHHGILGDRYSLSQVSLASHTALAAALSHAYDLWTTARIAKVIPLLLSHSLSSCSCNCAIDFLSSINEQMKKTISLKSIPEVNSEAFAGLLRMYFQKETFKKKWRDTKQHYSVQAYYRSLPRHLQE